MWYLQKTKIPARGLKRPLRQASARCRQRESLQKTKIPARGLKRDFRNLQQCGIEELQKTKIPARGLKHFIPPDFFECRDNPSSKNQNPREGIETGHNDFVGRVIHVVPSKNQNPREGIETECNAKPCSLYQHVASKNQNPREGIET